MEVKRDEGWKKKYGGCGDEGVVGGDVELGGLEVGLEARGGMMGRDWSEKSMGALGTR